MTTAVALTAVMKVVVIAVDFRSITESGPIPVDTAVASRVVHGVVDDDVAHGSRFRKWVANCNLNHSQSQACVKSRNIHGRGNMLLLEVLIGKGFLLTRRLIIKRKLYLSGTSILVCLRVGFPSIFNSL